MKFLASQLSYFAEDRLARRNLTAFLKYLAFLVGVILVFTALFHVLMQHEGQEHSWLTGLYWTLTVMSTLGFGDITFQSDLGRAFSVLVLIAGMVLMLIVLPFSFIRFFYAPWLEAQIRATAPRAAPPDTQDHVVLCRYDSLGARVAEELTAAGVPTLIIEPDPARAAELFLEHLPVIRGDVDARATYEGARVERARAVLANLDDPMNTNITLSLRELSATVKIIVTASEEASVDLLKLAGATHVLPLKRQLGEQLASRVNARHCEAHVVGKIQDLLIAEFPVQKTPLVGCTIRDTQLRQVCGVNVVGVWERGRLRPVNPDTRLGPSCVPVVVGTEPQIAELNELIQMFDGNLHPVIVIGGGAVGGAAAVALTRRDVPVHLVEKDPEVAARFEGHVERIFVGSAAERTVLDAAGVGKAPSVVLTTSDDAINIYLSIYCRRLNPNLRIISRVTHERNVEAIHRAGADFAISYSSLGSQAILASALNRELLFVGEGVDFFWVTVSGGLSEQTLAESAIGARTGLTVIALRHRGQTTPNPGPATRIPAGAELLAIGTAAQRKRLTDLMRESAAD